MTYEHRLRAFAVMMFWLLRRICKNAPAGVCGILERAGEALNDGDEAVIRKALEAIDPAFSAARRATRMASDPFDAGNFLQYAACAAMAAVLNAIRADRVIALEAGRCVDEASAACTVAGWEELELTYRAVSSCCRYASLAGVARDRLEVFQGLFPNWVFAEEG